MGVPAFLTEEEICHLQEQERMATLQQKRTPEQIEAIYTNGTNVLVSASAGSGKTFVMVERIVDKIKRGVCVDELFISTFTVKAAGELKERIEKKLTQALSETEDIEIRQHLSNQLARLDTADIGTMDSFTQRFVMNHGYTIGISPQFRILQDQNEQELLKNEVYAELFADYMNGKNRVDFLSLVKNFTGNRKHSKHFREVVYQIYQFSQSTSNPEKWLEETLLCGYQKYSSLEDIPEPMVRGLKEAMLQTANDLEDLTEHSDYKRVTAKGVATATFQKHEKIFSQLRILAEELTVHTLPEVLEKVVELLPSGSEVTVAKVKYPIYQHVKSRILHLQHIETILEYQPQVVPLLELLQQFVQEFSLQYLQRKRQENSYEFADISHFAIQILEDFPEIRASYQNRYHEVMVDEYQDNNHSQERMLDLLSNGKNRFMVGDVKQSIYRFRQADPQIFQKKFEDYQTDSSNGKLILLKENFRSQIEVLEATNAIFQHLMDKEVGEITYDQRHMLLAGSEKQRIYQTNNEMEFLLYDTDAKTEDGEISSGEVELVAKEIIRLFNEESIAFSDITLLVPSRTRNEDILSIFDKHGIPIVSDSGEGHYLQSLEVMVMLDTLRVIQNPLQDYPIVALLKSPMFRFDEDSLARIALQANKGKFYEKMKLALSLQGEHPELISDTLREKLSSFEGYLHSWREFSTYHSIYDLIWKIFNEKFYYEYVGALPNGEQRQANLYSLAVRANQFEQTGFKGLARFIRLIDKILASQKDLASVETALPQNAVQLMTIHKSKGLEFPYVFLMNTDKTFNTKDSQGTIVLSRTNGLGVQYIADMKEQFETALPHVRVAMNTLPYQINQRELRLATLSEQMRLLYVAMTRAEKKLYIVGKGSSEKLSKRYDGKKENGLLLASSRENLLSFQDWLLAIQAAFSDESLHYHTRFVTDEELTEHEIGKLQLQTTLPTSLRDNRQSDDIKTALEQLEAVEQLNQQYAAAILLPSVQTPSQIKKFYEPILDSEGVKVPEESRKEVAFELPDFSINKTVTGAEIGSATHELMQRLDVASPITIQTIEETLSLVNATQEVKEKIDISKIVYFFDTWLGKEIQQQKDNLRREVPFAALQLDAHSKEQFVLRGIVDGFIQYEDKIVLFDYKTDTYKNSDDIVKRYRSQMQLYVAALQQAYSISDIETYLVLLGGAKIEVCRVL